MLSASSAQIARAIPEELRALRQWVLWRYEIRDGKRTKVPYTCQGYRASVTNPEHRSTFDAVMKAFARPGFADGIGFAFTDSDPLCGLDLDAIWRSEGDEGADWAMSIIARFGDTYAEASPSDTGLKIWVRAKAPRCGRWPVENGAVEVYDHGRFFAVTGRSNGVTVVADYQQDIELLVANLDRFCGRGSAYGQPASAIGQKIPSGQRHDTLVSLAGTLWRRGLSSEEIEIALMAVNQRRCDPPHSAEHVRNLAASIGRWDR
jgi:hypothetical protein